MHEYHQAVRVIEQASAEARSRGHAKVTAIHLVIGESSGYSGETIRLYFEEAAKGTPCEGAGVMVRPVKTMLCCPGCQTLFERKPFSFDCPQCGAQGEPSEVGKEMAIERIDTKA